MYQLDLSIYCYPNLLDQQTYYARSYVFHIFCLQYTIRATQQDSHLMVGVHSLFLVADATIDPKN